MTKLDRLDQIYEGHFCPECAYEKQCSRRAEGPCPHWISQYDWVNEALESLSKLAEEESK